MPGMVWFLLDSGRLKHSTAEENEEVNCMEQLVVVRHGHDGDDGCLTSTGVACVRGLAEVLSVKYRGRGMIHMSSSPVKRAVQTAGIISEVLGTPFGTHPALDKEAGVVPYSRDSLPEFPDLLGLVQTMAPVFETVILVTHAGGACCFPMFYRVRALGLEQEPFKVVQKGSAQILDVSSGEISQL